MYESKVALMYELSSDAKRRNIVIRVKRGYTGGGFLGLTSEDPDTWQIYVYRDLANDSHEKRRRGFDLRSHRIHLFFHFPERAHILALSINIQINKD